MWKGKYESSNIIVGKNVPADREVVVWETKELSKKSVSNSLSIRSGNVLLTHILCKLSVKEA